MRFWRWLLTGSDWEPREGAWATRQLFLRAAADAELKPAVWKFKRAHPRKTQIGAYEARLLRFRRRA